eukprot:CAMPEP_0115005134 /NCGR_PEP_ID=MMETSP0216-20121206/19673_1 /TAXON_ID=223996 /ORGANISM="Protocruzia adherens, Strain Boccale" /LENGTH=131 /DNA_ID=CAMNT_0002371367 /DNA_START=308 /DNA_END=700 /DNA_ORIENTATION=+
MLKKPYRLTILQPQDYEKRHELVQMIKNNRNEPLSMHLNPSSDDIYQSGFNSVMRTIADGFIFLSEVYESDQDRWVIANCMSYSDLALSKIYEGVPNIYDTAWEKPMNIIIEQYWNQVKPKDEELQIGAHW